jgi:hypothetical protein
MRVHKYVHVREPESPVRSVQVSDSLWHRAVAEAERRGESVSSVVRNALRATLPQDPEPEG